MDQESFTWTATKKLIPIAVFFFSFAGQLFGKDFVVFDGKIYNGKRYPRVDIIEWSNTTPPADDKTWMEFHTYYLDQKSKINPIQYKFKLVEEKGKKILLVQYQVYGENLCRRIQAPSHFNDQYHLFIDRSDPEMERLVLKMDQGTPYKKADSLKKEAYLMSSCAETEDRLDEDKKNPARPSVEKNQRRLPAAESTKPIENQKSNFDGWL